MSTKTTPWWTRQQSFEADSLTPPNESLVPAGPRGLAYVQVNPDGSTAEGWGGAQFMGKYLKRAFDVRRALAVFRKKGTPFAMVMRSTRLVCLDIDGKNGGIESASMLNLPETLAETSKSGNGYHLFYLVDDTWDPAFGFERLRDRIGWRTGIDVRAVGCVYHYPTQRWNTLAPAPLPEHILIDLETASQAVTEKRERLLTLSTSTDPDDQMEFLLMQDTIQSRLAEPIPAGKRNNTLFAIGCEMKAAQILGWEQQVLDRATQIGLAEDEAEKLVGNIRKYG